MYGERRDSEGIFITSTESSMKEARYVHRRDGGVDEEGVRSKETEEEGGEGRREGGKE